MRLHVVVQIGHLQRPIQLQFAIKAETDTYLGKAASAFRLIAHKGTLARMETSMIVKVCDLGEGLAAVHALIRPIICVYPLVITQIGRLRKACNLGWAID